MAEKSQSKVFVESDSEQIDCAVCLQSCVNPTVLPCGHIFCYLCVKGLRRTTKMCAMCRQQFPNDLIENPPLLRPIEPSLNTGFEDGYQWFYEGRNGWWQYDERTSKDIEDAFKRGITSCDISVAGKIYIVDFVEMEQKQKQNVLRSRRIKRDLSTIPKKGISGIRAAAATAQSTEDLETRLATLNLFQPGDE